MAIWFISDLHLDPARPAVAKLLLEFLEVIRPQAEALYILGDFFEYWIGDDVLETPAGQVFMPVIQGLRRLTDAGIPLYVMHGNRDFLLRDGFAGLTGCTMLPESLVIDVYGESVLLLHGDELCTDDVEYQQVRKMFRDPQWQARALSLPLEERIRQALAIRGQSQEATRGKMEAIMDVNQAAVEAVLRQHAVKCLIHGHTHRPATHHLLLDGRPARRIVLGDWHADHGSYLCCTPEGMELHF